MNRDRETDGAGHVDRPGPEEPLGRRLGHRLRQLQGGPEHHPGEPELYPVEGGHRQVGDTALLQQARLRLYDPGEALSLPVDPQNRQTRKTTSATSIRTTSRRHRRWTTSRAVTVRKEIDWGRTFSG